MFTHAGFFAFSRFDSGEKQMINLMKSLFGAIFGRTNTAQIPVASLAPVPTKSLGETIAEIAHSQIGLRENKGKNQGDGLSKYWEATDYKDGYKNREPYCAAFVCWCVMTAILTRGVQVLFKRPTTALAFGLQKWANAQSGNGVKILGGNMALNRGDIIVFTFSHTGIVAQDSPAGFPTVATVEANTNDAGGREGDGVYRKARNRSQIRCVIRLA